MAWRLIGLSKKVETRRRVLGDEHDSLESMRTLAKSYKKMGRGDDARPLLAELLSSQRMRAEASSEPDASNGYAELARALRPVLVRLLAVGQKFAPPSEMDEQVSDSVYVMF